MTKPIENMMKVLILVLTLTIVACGQRSAEKSASKSGNSDSKKIHMTDDKPESKDFEKLGFDLMKNETLDKLKLGLKLSDLINILGEPNVKTNNEFWGADGEYHQTFKYSSMGIELDLIGENEGDKIVNMITIQNPCDYKTTKRISVGNDYQDVKEAYKEYLNPEFSNSESIVAGSIYGGVIFRFENGKVKSIFIGASAD
jgi:uncharacterized lipoprotein YehR (DUF1307 family)